MRRLLHLFTPRDMTEGPPWKRILDFTVPMLLGNFAQQLYNAADSAIVGKYVGDNALAAVGSAGPILFFLLALFVGIANGAGILVSQYFGAKDRHHLSVTIGNCITLTALASLLVMVVGTALVWPALRLLNTPEVYIAWTADYLRVFFLGIVGFMYYNVLAGVLRGLGDSLSALGFLLLATFLNVVLDLWFVIGFGLGVFGVALATVLAQAISAALCALKLLRMTEVFDLNPRTLKLHRPAAEKIIRLGLPSGVTQAIFSMAMLWVTRLQNSFGPTFVAATVIVMRVDGFAMMPNFSFGQAMTTFVGQNAGAGRHERFRQGARQGTLLAMSVAAMLTVAILLFGRPLMRLFTDTAELVDLSMRMMSILAPGYIAMAIIQSLSGTMRGAGDTVTPMWISILTSVVLRVPAAYLLVHLTKSPSQPNGMPESIFTSMLLAWVIGAVLNLFAYRHGRWHTFLPKETGQADLPAS